MAMLRKVRMALVAVAVALLASMPAAAQDNRAGRIVSATPMAGAPAGASAYRIRYRSADTFGKPIIVSGAVIVPGGGSPASGRDVVVWAHGASGIAETCGLSDKPGLYDLIAGLRPLLAAGYVVVAPDYQGLGNPGPHPMLVGTAAAHSVIDAVRAVRDMRAVRATARYAIFGESLGAFSALWSGIESARYAPELTLVGVAAAAPPTDLKANLTGGSNVAVRAFLTAYTASSWEQVYGLPLTTVVRPHTAVLIRNLARNCVSLDGFKLRTKLGMLRLAIQLKNVDLAASPRWAALMEQNSVNPSAVALPVFVQQGGKDVIVAPAVTEAFVARLCRRNRNVRYIVTPAGDHVSAGKTAAPDAVAWIRDRFAGRPPPSDCRKL
uniref:alpha/beta fold hydrolase n=1 Tax=uncultured Sphingomonas sp. TaxID=158754 RepID=UPI0035CC4080